MRFKILSVDELGISRIELSNCLRNLDVEIQSAKDEIEALNLLREYKSNINIIVWTFNTVDETGFESIKRIKQKEAYRNIPVVIISKYTDKKYIIKAIQAGATEFIAKPYDENTILNKFASLLGVPLEKKSRKKIDDDIVTFNFSEMMSREIKAASRGSYPLSILLAAVTGQPVNGKEDASQEITELIYKVIKTKLRDTDSVFLYGSNNMVAILPFAGKEGAATVEDKVRQIFNSHSVINSNNPGYSLITTSVSFPEDGRIKQKLLEKLEKKLSDITRVKV